MFSNVRYWIILPSIVFFLLILTLPILKPIYAHGPVSHNYKEAAQRYRLAAEKGDTEAQYNLGSMYYWGRGVLKDDKKSVQWYRAAANQGHVLAQYNLGTMHAEKRGVEKTLQWYDSALLWLGLIWDKNDKEAVRWYRIASNQGYAPAQHSLGVMYVEGRGISQNYVQAHMWFDLSASQSVGKTREETIKNKNLVAKKMTEKEIERAQQLVRNWTPSYILETQAATGN
jgi:hypothetical protein